jgi:hypothetical protein
MPIAPRPTLVQTVVTNFASVATINQAITVTNAGDTLILTVTNRGITAGYAATAVSGAGATWYRLVSGVNGTAGSGAIDIWAGVGALLGAQTVAITINGTQISGCNLDEWQYLNNSALISNYAAALSSTGSSVSASLTMTADTLNEVVYIASSAANTETANPAAFWNNLPGPTSAGAQVAGIIWAVSNAVGNMGGTWTQATGTWTTVGVLLQPQQGPGDVIWNDPAASINAGVLGQQASPDMLDFVNDTLAAQGTGVLSGCAVSPPAQSAGGLLYNLTAGTVLINWNPIQISAVLAQAMATADPTNPRKDMVYIDMAGVIHFLAGTPAAVPCLPNPPQFPFVMLAQIDVPPNASLFDNSTSTTQAHVTDKRVFVSIPPSISDYTVMPSGPGPTFETFSRRYGNNAALLTSGTLSLHAIWLPAGLPVGHIFFMSGTTAAGTPTNYWFGLWDSSRRQLCLTANQLTAAWAANTGKSLAVASSLYAAAATTFVTSYSGLYYVGIMVAATTVPSLMGTGNGSLLSAIGPSVAGNSTTALTTPPAYTGAAATAVSGGAGMAYAFVSR